MLLTKMKTEELIFDTEKWEWKNVMFKVFSIPVPEEANWHLENGRLKVKDGGVELTGSGFILDKEFFHGQASIMLDIIDGYNRASYEVCDIMKKGKNYVSQKLKKGAEMYSHVISSSFEFGNKVVILNFAAKAKDNNELNSFESKLTHIIENTNLILN